MIYVFIFETIIEIDKIDNLNLYFHLLNFLGDKERNLDNFKDIFTKSDLIKIIELKNNENNI